MIYEASPSLIALNIPRTSHNGQVRSREAAVAGHFLLSVKVFPPVPLAATSNCCIYNYYAFEFIS